MRDVLPAQGVGRRVGLEVVVAVGEPEPRLVELADVARALLRVGLRGEIKGGEDLEPVEAPQLGLQVTPRADRVDAPQLVRDGRRPRALGGRGVHAAGVEGAELLEGRIVGGVDGGRRALQYLAQRFRVAVVQLAAGPGARVGGRDRGGLEPRAVREPEKVGAGGAGRVQVRARHAVLRGERRDRGRDEQDGGRDEQAAAGDHVGLSLTRESGARRRARAGRRG